MAAIETLTWDIANVDGGARRPSITDLGDALLVDDAAHPPPNDGSHLYAAMCNQQAKQIAAIGRTMDGLKLTIDFAASVPFVDRVQSASAVIADNPSGVFTLTDNGVGDTTIAWAARTFPALVCDPQAWMGGSGSWIHPIVEVVSATSIRVRTRNSSATLADGRFTVAF